MWEENRRTRRKTLEARERTNYKLNEIFSLLTHSIFNLV
jgi:hypothetical protein